MKAGYKSKNTNIFLGLFAIGTSEHFSECRKRDEGKERDGGHKEHKKVLRPPTRINSADLKLISSTMPERDSRSISSDYYFGKLANQSHRVIMAY